MDDPADGIIDCLPGYYFNGTSCVECPAGHFCTGGIAVTGVGGAVSTACPVGTYNTNVQSDALTDCTPINRDTETVHGGGLGYYGTKLGAIDDHDGFQMCPQNTHINTESDKNTVDDCDADEKYIKIPTTDASTGLAHFIIELKPQYADEDTCLPGTIEVVNTETGTPVINCEDPPTTFNYDDPRQKYLSGTSSTEDNCVSTPAGDITLKNCDAFTNSIVNTVSNVKRIHTDEFGNRIMQCNLGYEQIHYHILDTTNLDTAIADAQKKIIEDTSEFYLYQLYDAFDLENARQSQDWDANDANFHLNTKQHYVNVLKTALRQNLKVNPSSKGALKIAIKDYKAEKDKIPDDLDRYYYQLLFYNDIEVYQRGDGKKIMRYIYGILPNCQACPSGFTSDGYSLSLIHISEPTRPY